MVIAMSLSLHAAAAETLAMAGGGGSVRAD